MVVLAVAHPWASASSSLSSQGLADSRCNLHPALFTAGCGALTLLLFAVLGPPAQLLAPLQCLRFRVSLFPRLQFTIELHTHSDTLCRAPLCFLLLALHRDFFRGQTHSCLHPGTTVDGPSDVG